MNNKKIFENMKKEFQNYDILAAEKQHKKHKLSVYERIKILLDEESFVEIGQFIKTRSTEFGLDKKVIPRDGVLTGYGTINSRRVFVYAQDFSAHGGTVGEVQAKKIEHIQKLALENGAPLISLIDSGGARIEEGISALDGFGRIFTKNVEASGVIPQISIILGNCAGGAAYSPGLTDFIFMVEDISNMFVTGPKVIEKVIGEKVSMKDLGSSSIHSSKSGVSHFNCSSEEEALEQVKILLSYLPSNYLELAPKKFTGDSYDRETTHLETLVPEDTSMPYDIKSVINEIFDTSSFFEVQKDYANNAITGFARLNSQSVAIVANQPMQKAGCLNIEASEKIARFVNFCDAFNIPIINLVDVPGYFPGVDQETRGIIKHGAGILYAYAQATVPKISIIIRKAYGGAYIAMASKTLKYDMVFAWPGAEIAVMGPEQACEILYRRDMEKKSFNFEKKVEEYKKKYLNPFEAAKSGAIDEIIEPKDTRKTLLRTLDILQYKREAAIKKKHGNMPM